MPPAAIQTGTSATSTITQGSGVLTLAGNLYVNQTGTGAIGAGLPGSVILAGGPRDVVVADGTAAADLTFAGTLGGAAVASFIKQNSGTLLFPTGKTETYVGETLVNQGTLIVNGTSIRITHMRPDFVLVESPTDHPPCEGFLFLRVDDSESQWKVRLPNGISAGSKRVALAHTSNETPPPA